MDTKAELVRELCSLLLVNERGGAASFAREYLPFTKAVDIGIKEYENLLSYSSMCSDTHFGKPNRENNKGSRKYSKHTIMEVFLRDGFIDRYTGVKLIHPGILTLLHLELPDIFKYHGGWKLGQCHTIFWELFPTVDHIVPITTGGSDDMVNLLTISMIGNTRKRNLDLSILRWKIHPPGDLRDWDGLTDVFLELMERNDRYRTHTNASDTQIRKLNDWYRVTKRTLDTPIDGDQTIGYSTEKGAMRNNPMNNVFLKFEPFGYAKSGSQTVMTFNDLPIGHLFAYGSSKTIYRKLLPIGNSLGRVVNLCRPKSDDQREWGLRKPSELERIVRPIEESKEVLSKLFL